MVRPLRVSLWEKAEAEVQKYGWTGLKEYLEDARSCHPHLRRRVSDIADALTDFAFGEFVVSSQTVSLWCKAVL